MRADSHTQSRVPFTCAYVCVSSAQYDARTRALPLCNTNLSVLLGRILLPHCMWHTKAAATTKDALTHTQTHTHIHRHIVRTRANAMFATCLLRLQRTAEPALRTCGCARDGARNQSARSREMFE